MLTSLVIQDPRLDVARMNEEHTNVIQGAERITHVRNIALSSSAAQANWNIQPPRGVIVDRNILVNFYVTFDITFQNSVGSQAFFDTTNLESIGKVCFAPGVSWRQAPVASILESCSVIINGENLNDNISQKTHAFLTYGNNSLDEHLAWSRSSLDPDLAQDYKAYDATGGGNRNPMAGIFHQVRGINGRCPPFLNWSSTTNPDNTVTVTFSEMFTEPLWMSPFGADYGKVEGGLCNVDSLNVIQRYHPLVNMLSVGGNLAVSNAWKWVTDNQNFSARLSQPPEILTNYLSPNPSYSFPASQVLPYIKNLDYVTVPYTIAPGSSQLISFDTIRLAQIPEAVYIFGAPNSVYTYQDVTGKGAVVPNAFISITSVNITFENQSAILGTFSVEQLYETCLRNGCNLSYDEWRYHKGTVLKLNFSKDIGITPGNAVGQLGNFSFQAQVTAVNQLGTGLSAANSTRITNPASMSSFQFWQIFVMPGSVMIAPGTAKSTLGLIPVAAAMRGTYNEMEDSKFYGGGVSKATRWTKSRPHVSAISGGADTLYGKRKRM